MIKLKDILLSEAVTKQQLIRLEEYLDDLFEKVGLDIEFTRHFLERLNHPRNRPEITEKDVLDTFKKTYEKYGSKVSDMGEGAEAVLINMMNDVNIPFVLQYNKDKQEFDLISKTIMRKKNFKTYDSKLKV